MGGGNDVMKVGELVFFVVVCVFYFWLELESEVDGNSWGMIVIFIWGVDEGGI